MFLFEAVMISIASLVLFVISVVLHELSHFLTMKLLGIRPNKPVVVLFQIPKKKFDPWGFVGSCDDTFNCSHDYFEIAWFFVCISGGIGSSVLIIPFYFLPYFQIPVLSMIVVHLTSALFEGWNSLKPS